MRKFLVGLLLASVAISVAVAKNPFEKFTGSYHLSAAPIMDSDSPLPDSTHVYLNIEGDAAKRIYEAMTVKPYENGCDEDHFAKDAGDFTCVYYPSSKKYFCYFSVDINKGRLDSIGSC